MNPRAAVVGGTAQTPSASAISRLGCEHWRLGRHRNLVEPGVSMPSSLSVAGDFETHWCRLCRGSTQVVGRVGGQFTEVFGQGGVGLVA